MQSSGLQKNIIANFAQQRLETMDNCTKRKLAKRMGQNGMRNAKMMCPNERKCQMALPDFWSTATSAGNS